MTCADTASVDCRIPPAPADARGSGSFAASPSWRRGAQYSMYSRENDVTPEGGEPFAGASLTKPADPRAGTFGGVSTLTTIDLKTVSG